MINFRTYLRKTYPSPLLNVANNIVESSETMDFFQDPINQAGLKEPRTAPKEASDTVGQFHPAEVQVIENVLLQACGKDLYKRFEFEEFFRVKRSPPQKAITFNPVDGHLKVIVACVMSLEDGSNIDTRALRAYAINNLPWHIHEVILSDLAVKDPKGTADAIKHLHLLFTEESYMRIWLSPKESDDTRKTWLRDDTIVHDILGLYQNKAVQSTKIAPKAKLWINRLEAKPISLYKEAAEFMAKQWLRQDTWEVMSAFRWVRECDTSNFDPESADDDISFEEIQQVAESAWKLLDSKTEDAMALTRLAETMFGCSEHFASKDYCDRALKLNSAYWRATWCSIRISRQLWDIGEAVSCLQQLVQEYHKDHESFSPGDIETWKDVLEYAADLSQECEELDQAVIYSRMLHDIAPEDHNTTQHIVALMSGAKQFSILLEFLEKLRGPITDKHHDNSQHNQDKDKVQDRNGLTALFIHCADSIDFHEQIAYAVKVECNQLRKEQCEAMIEAAFEAAIRLAGEIDDGGASLRYYYGLWLYHGSQVKEGVRRAIGWWEENLGGSNPPDGTSMRRIRSKSTSKLITAYLDECKRLAPKSSSEQAREYLKLFKSLPKSQQAVADKATDLLIARLCHKNNIDEAEIQKRVKPHMLEALRILENDDPDDDWYGYMLLAQIPSPIDEKNALAAWKMLGPSEDFRYRPGIYRCDGRCGHYWKFADDMHYCKDCFDVQFDKKCLVELKARKLERRVCNPDHEFFRVPPYDPKTAFYPKENHIYVDGKEIEVKKWIELLKVKYCMIDARFSTQQIMRRKADGNIASQ